MPIKLSLLGSDMRAYDQVVNPFSSDDDYKLRYQEWELSNRTKVDKLLN